MGTLEVHLRLVFTSDGVLVGVVIRRVERYDLVKIKRRSRKQNNDSAYDSVGYDQVKTGLSESQKRKNKPMTMFDSTT